MAYTPTVLPGPVGGSSVIALGASVNTFIIVGVCLDSGSNQRACYWDQSRAVHLLPNLAGGTSAVASGCSSDASRIVGQAADGGGVLRPVVWTFNGVTYTIAQLPDLGHTSGGTSGGALAASFDDTTIVGSVVNASSFNQACAWRAPSWTLTALTGLSGNNSTALGVSISGSTIVGEAQVTGGQLHGAKWSGGPTWSAAIDLGLVSGGTNAIAYGTSGNASTIVGAGAVSGPTEALSWTIDGPGTLAVPAGATSPILARGVDLSGIYIGGYAAFSGVDKPVLWTNGTPQVLGFPGGYSGAIVTGIGPDAATLYGVTTVPSSVAIAWIGPPPSVVDRTFLVCGNNWTISQTKTQFYGLDHLIGQNVNGLADGVAVGPLMVQPDGSVTLPFPASYVTLGKSYTVQLQTPYLDTGNPTIQGRRKNITAVTVRVDSSAVPMVGSNQPDGGAFTPTQVNPVWTNLQPAVTNDPEQAPQTYVNPSGEKVTQLFSGDFRANLQPGWEERGQTAVQQTLPVPLSVTAVIPELTPGDVPDPETGGGGQGQGGQQQGEGPGLWMLQSTRGR